MNLPKNSHKIVAFLCAVATLVLAGCSPATPTPLPTPDAFALTTPIPPNASGYRPLQAGDNLEGATIDFQYIYPSLEKPVVDIALGKNLLQLIVVKPELTNGLVSYIQEITSQRREIYAYDENDLRQSEPRLMTIEPNKPVEIAIIPLDDKPHLWSVKETQDGETRTAYKLVRRSDGGLRFIDAYDQVTLHSGTFATTNGLGLGLIFSARLALLKAILSNQRYQRGQDVMSNPVPSPDQYDPRILKLNPQATGLAQDVDWILIARPGPNPGQASP
ncbi:MAG: hypothetical protein WCF84_10220 [Anaerolineae bacterium]